jgi:hypothetical protein
MIGDDLVDDLVIFDGSSERDPDGSRLRGALQAAANREHARGMRELLVYLLAILSVPLWLSGVRPSWLSHDLRVLAATAWAVASVGLLFVLASEWRWARRRAARLSGLVARGGMAKQSEP